ncbi:MAG: ABC transporter permease, partial [Desulforhabdus sp.]|nr:ABC transporter permease [Desulforhabdus sp.]
KSLKQELAAPINLFHLIAGSWLMGVIHSLLVLAILSGFSAYAFGFRLLGPGVLPIALFFCGLLLTSAAVGIIVCALAFRFGGRAHVGANSIVSVLVLLSGIYYPVEVLPAPLQIVSGCIPVTHLLAYFRSFYGFPIGASHGLWIGYGLAVFYLAAATAILLAAVHHSKKSGILLKMSE